MFAAQSAQGRRRRGGASGSRQNRQKQGAPPFRIAEFDMMHTNGISYEGEFSILGWRKGSYPQRGLVQIWRDAYRPRQGKGRAFLQENPQITAELREKIIASGVLTGGVASAGEAGE